MANALKIDPSTGLWTEPFIRVSEIWLPSADGSMLVHGGGLYGDLSSFREESERTTFKRGQGLPGRAWADRQPIVFADLQEADFLRKDAAAEAGLNCGVAVPLFAGETLKAVTVFFCGSDAKHIGAVEVWRYDPKIDTQIGLVDGYFGAASLFEWTSRRIKFGLGRGLPGKVWQADAPVILTDIYRPGQFLRHKEAQTVGINVGMGIPIASQPGVTYVLSFLSAARTPIARRFEMWTVQSDGDLLLTSGHCASGIDLTGAYSAERPGTGSDTSFIGRALQSGQPVAVDDFAGQPEWLAQSAQDARLVCGLALPVYSSTGAITAVMCWYL